MADEEWFKASTFEQKFRVLAKAEWKPKLRRQSAEQAAYMCMCGKCPSYLGTGETQLVFCTIGKSNLIHQQKNCLCEHCGVTKTMSMRWDSYCIKGSALELSDLTEK
nr:DUF2769 domain-containing protein [Candidatus Njordarchaeum guaymaensis]